MEDPVAEIPTVIHLLTQSPPSLQEETINRFFTPNAEFVHPFCRIWSVPGSRWGVKKIYQWYKIMSPRIDMEVQSVAYDKQNLKLYVTIFQIFRIWIFPFYSAPVTLTSVLDLTTETGEMKASSSNPAEEEGKKRYYIQKQEDLYQVSEFIKFVVPFGIGHMTVMMWHAFASFFSIFGVFALWPIMWAEESGYFDAFYATRRGLRDGVVDALNGSGPGLRGS
ncbi:hypothetical protein BJX61DRAFT_502640 [Aspergillus egyptiacus]|nr:hypothetical protein BJX61DRAFT_502640 [Aspergillus egyptiacus]